MSGKNEFLIALQFLTRLPVPEQTEHSDEAFARSARFYPAVGLVVGAASALVFFLGSDLVGENVAALLALLSAILITGGLHEDGLADTADGLGGGRDREHALTIMRDSSIGAYGVLALLFSQALVWSVLMAWPDWSICWALIAAHGLSRSAITEVIGRYEYARKETVKFARPTLNAEDLTFARLWALGIGIVSILTIGFGATLCGFLVAGLFVSGLVQIFQRKLGGYTGDCLGATQQVALIGFLIGALMWL